MKKLFKSNALKKKRNHTLPFLKNIPFLFFFLLLFYTPAYTNENAPKPSTSLTSSAPSNKIYVLPIQGPVGSGLEHFIRRGLKEAMAQNAQAIVLDMNTPGGAVHDSEKIMKMLQKFKPEGATYTFVHDDALSAGAFLACATRHIYMSKNGVIGAAAPVLSSPTGGGQDIPATMDAKVKSVLRAMIRETARNNGHRPEVFEAMIESDLELKIDGQIISPKGELLSLTASEAAQKYGKPPKPLLSEGTVETLDDLIQKIAAPNTSVETITLQPTGYEQLASHITIYASLLFTAGLLFAYLEFQTQGFGLFGLLSLLCFLIFFFGHHVAGLTGYETLLIFGLGIALIFVEIFLFPGTLVSGITGLLLVLGALLWAMVDYYPGEPIFPSFAPFATPLFHLSSGILLAFLLALLLGLFLPQALGHKVLDEATVVGAAFEASNLTLGMKGKTTTTLHPIGIVQFQDKRVEVITQGQAISCDQWVEIIHIEGVRIVVQPTSQTSESQPE